MRDPVRLEFPFSDCLQISLFFALSEVKNYELPFGSMAREQPCVETMRDVVLHGRGRPDLPDSWRRHSVRLTVISCPVLWLHDPDPLLLTPLTFLSGSGHPV